MINVAEVCQATRALGPGLRAVVWVQGCPFRCRECVSPEWLEYRPATMFHPGELARRLLSQPDVTGFTFSGGEPMTQAKGLAATIRTARQQRDLSLICFSGYTLAELHGERRPDGAEELLSEVDVLIDGRYRPALNDGRGLRGSANQRVHHLTRRLRDSDYDFEGRPREAEIQLSDSVLRLVGVPPLGLLPALDHVWPARVAPNEGDR
ncbi:4Fe-4S single cluster domain-containing protein [Acrocarpospora macrocephala]|uniref:Anaerobic ribonucleoside-triphosphate reductase activating protein n=2 Tax=Acrocarpospora macrocephala TaxID=150177 RepID=A0A5M3WTM7_9ACTN|nr:4Fe-4S single cluster domain-containing protein [Acrocarpospora macrocephala]GES11876.1 anaerobic ribonucleoside-triphosphate reductase activating protein [Acrocarpospora macrocephala]